MKKVFWIFLFVGLIGVILWCQRKKGITGLAGVLETEFYQGTPLEPVSVIPGTDIPVGLRPRPGNGLLGF